MAMTASADVPMGEINMTPLIDVMLVLLVMFIITIPLQTHAVKIDLPNDCPACPRVTHFSRVEEPQEYQRRGRSHGGLAHPGIGP